MSNEAMKMALAKQLTIALQNLGAPVELLCIVGSYGDTQIDSDVLEMLEKYNSNGSCIHSLILSVEDTPQTRRERISLVEGGSA
ncbi:hypothetical protein EKN44_19150 [Enterobacter hormaechei]|uniref:hypothetical protein n=1 Tax=Enterobacter hormaechei TaxID=158836 RepID=UPI000F849B78|nr:hypothetical protein [Enterobacter hormaechei]MCM8478028.1 hypothetical protein [Enterobacter hormaechei]RTP50953.1 hypothetical protein EKN44_19150 [Enterobacter hormaechei]HBL6038407.1 hypothetical protein [Enterobacter hormaechei]